MDVTLTDLDLSTFLGDAMRGWDVDWLLYLKGLYWHDEVHKNTKEADEKQGNISREERTLRARIVCGYLFEMWSLRQVYHPDSTIWISLGRQFKIVSTMLTKLLFFPKFRSNQEFAMLLGNDISCGTHLRRKEQWVVNQLTNLTTWALRCYETRRVPAYTAVNDVVGVQKKFSNSDVRVSTIEWLLKRVKLLSMLNEEKIKEVSSSPERVADYVWAYTGKAMSLEDSALFLLEKCLESDAAYDSPLASEMSCLSEDVSRNRTCGRWLSEASLPESGNTFKPQRAIDYDAEPCSMKKKMQSREKPEGCGDIFVEFDGERKPEKTTFNRLNDKFSSISSESAVTPEDGESILWDGSDLTCDPSACQSTRDSGKINVGLHEYDVASLREKCEIAERELKRVAAELDATLSAVAALDLRSYSSEARKIRNDSGMSFPSSKEQVNPSVASNSYPLKHYRAQPRAAGEQTWLQVASKNIRNDELVESKDELVPEIGPKWEESVFEAANLTREPAGGYRRYTVLQNPAVDKKRSWKGKSDVRKRTEEEDSVGVEHNCHCAKRVIYHGETCSLQGHASIVVSGLCRKCRRNDSLQVNAGVTHEKWKILTGTVHLGKDVKYNQEQFEKYGISRLLKRLTKFVKRRKSLPHAQAAQFINQEV